MENDGDFVDVILLYFTTSFFCNPEVPPYKQCHRCILVMFQNSRAMSSPPPPRVPHFSEKQNSKDVGLSCVVFIPFEFKFAVFKM